MHLEVTVDEIERFRPAWSSVTVAGRAAAGA